MISFENSSMASFGSPVLPMIGVTIGPGATVLTRRPRPASSAAVVRAKERIAALVAEYALVPGVPVWPAALVFRMIDAPSDCLKMKDCTFITFRILRMASRGSLRKRASCQDADQELASEYRLSV